MTATVAAIWRHPIKAHGAEPLDRVTLSPGSTLPGDRRWAVAHEGARAESGAWSPCANFARGAKAPALMAITARLDEVAGRVTLTHPDRPDITVDPVADADTLVAWSAPLIPQGRAAPCRVVEAGADGMTDSDFPSVSVLGTASLRTLSEKAGHALDQRRFRGNLWLDRLAPWEEFDLVGRRLLVGDAILEIRERITRCRATHADPDTGHADTDILGLLEDGWGHRDFGVYAVVTQGGSVTCGDAVAVL